MEKQNIIAHANPNHDPETGRFTTGASVAGAIAGDVSRGAKDIARNIPKDENDLKKVYKNYPDLSDADLNRMVARLEKEHKLSDLRDDTEVVKSGKQKAREIIDRIGDIAGIFAAGAIIYGAIQRARE